MRLLLAASAALVVSASAAAAPPRAGLVIPGKSFGGLTLGATRGQVRAAWGPRFGVCRGCREQTWYFNYRAFEPQGAGVSFRARRAVALFTLGSPKGWRTDRGLRIGDSAVRIAGLYGPLLQIHCGTYSAFTIRRGSTTTAFYVVDERVWAFGLSRPKAPVCR
ncbi:MAG TPA: hypothetical protein VGQ68_07695 [Gaiellaceae bacterium]|jgi:hypothetical protein|nr:hypothetical protein [Gaiellaceae bacterium]